MVSGKGTSLNFRPLEKSFQPLTDTSPQVTSVTSTPGDGKVSAHFPAYFGSSLLLAQDGEGDLELEITPLPAATEDGGLFFETETTKRAVGNPEGVRLGGGGTGAYFAPVPEGWC